MKKQTLALAFLSLTLTAPALAQTVLYDAAGGQKVSQFGGWFVFPTNLETFSSSSTLYDTSALNSLQGGFSRQDRTLSRAAGLSLGFTMQVTSETHDGTNGPNRSGVSVIAITSGVKG